MISLIVNTIPLLCIGLFVQQTQQVVTTSGGIATGRGGTAGYTVGRIVKNKIIGSNGTVSQGVQHPYEISVITAIEAATDISLIFSVPNTISITCNSFNGEPILINEGLNNFISSLSD